MVSNLHQIVSRAELLKIKVLPLREIPLSQSRVERIATGWLDRSLLDLPLGEPVRAATRYLRFDATAVRAAFAEWIRPGDLVQVNEGPAPR